MADAMGPVEPPVHSPVTSQLRMGTPMAENEPAAYLAANRTGGTAIKQRAVRQGTEYGRQPDPAADNRTPASKTEKEARMRTITLKLLKAAAFAVMCCVPMGLLMLMDWVCEKWDGENETD